MTSGAASRVSTRRGLRLEHRSDAIVLRGPERPDGAGPLPRTLGVVVDVTGTADVRVAQSGTPAGRLSMGHSTFRLVSRRRSMTRPRGVSAPSMTAQSAIRWIQTD